MYYHPRRRGAIELLKLAGFTHTGPGLGWEKVQTIERKGLHVLLPQGERLHATAHYGYINMHYDVVANPKQHIARPSHWRVKEELQRIAKLDRDWRDDAQEFAQKIWQTVAR